MVGYNVTLEGKTVLVTGAAGFIGSNLVKRLFHDVKDIKVIGNRINAYHFNVRYIVEKTLYEIAAYKAGGTCYKNSLAF